MEYLWLMLAVIGLPVLLLLRALRRLHDEPAVGFRHDIYEGRVQQAVRKVAPAAPVSAPEQANEPLSSPAPPPEIAGVSPDGHEEAPPLSPVPLTEPAPDKRKALIQALLLSEILTPRRK